MSLTVFVSFVCLFVLLLVFVLLRRAFFNHNLPDAGQRAKDLGLVFPLLKQGLQDAIPRGASCRTILLGEFLVLREMARHDGPQTELSLRVVSVYYRALHVFAGWVSPVSARLERLVLLEQIMALEWLASCPESKAVHND